MVGRLAGGGGGGGAIRGVDLAGRAGFGTAATCLIGGEVLIGFDALVDVVCSGFGACISVWDALGAVLGAVLGVAGMGVVILGAGESDVAGGVGGGGIEAPLGGPY